MLLFNSLGLIVFDLSSRSNGRFPLDLLVADGVAFPREDASINSDMRGAVGIRLASFVLLFFGFFFGFAGKFCLRPV